MNTVGEQHWHGEKKSYNHMNNKRKADTQLKMPRSCIKAMTKIFHDFSAVYNFSGVRGSLQFFTTTDAGNLSVLVQRYVVS